MKTIPRRRREHKTDYGHRLKLLKSGKPRAVFRRTNRFIIAQYVESAEARDKIVISADSSQLLSFGWPKEKTGSLKSVSAAYLTAFLLGKRIIKNKLKEPIVDFGLQRVLSKSRLQAGIKGLLDSGIALAHKEDALPPEERVMGKHLEGVDVVTIKSAIEKQ